MITSEAVGEWFWDPAPFPDTAESGASKALALLEDVGAALACLGLVTGEGTGAVVLCGLGAMTDPLFECRDVALDGPGFADAADRAAAFGLLPGRLLTLSLKLPGEWREAGVRRRAERLFTVRVDVWGEGAVLLALSTYADPWLTQDLRERPQPEVAAENAPRLAAALERISALACAEVDPGDETRHARPTADGFADLLAEGAAYEDSWGTFEVPARWQRLMRLLPGGYGEEDYEATTDGPVRYAEVRCGEGLLGFLWASADGAAGYEPRSAAGDAAFEAGVPWLLRLRAARGGGDSALEALDGCLGRTEDGWAVGAAVSGAASLDVLQELSGRG